MAGRRSCRMPKQISDGWTAPPASAQKKAFVRGWRTQEQENSDRRGSFLASLNSGTAYVGTSGISWVERRSDCDRSRFTYVSSRCRRRLRRARFLAPRRAWRFRSARAVLARTAISSARSKWCRCDSSGAGRTPGCRRSVAHPRSALAPSRERAEAPRLRRAQDPCLGRGRQCRTLCS
jgi:hypothetical protein